MKLTEVDKDVFLWTTHEMLKDTRRITKAIVTEENAYPRDNNINVAALAGATRRETMDFLNSFKKTQISIKTINNRPSDHLPIKIRVFQKTRRFLSRKSSRKYAVTNWQNFQRNLQ